MKALTLTQPWATLVAIGAKHFETRSWSTPYRGPLAIHAGKGLKPVGGMRGLRALCATEPFRSVLTDAGYADPASLPRGIIVAECHLIGCAEVCGYAIEPGGLGVRGAEHERDFGDFTPGRFAWILGNVGFNHTPPISGALGLWKAPCLSNPHGPMFCTKPSGHDDLHRDGLGRTWNWGDS